MTFFCTVCKQPATLRLRDAVDIQLCERGTHCQRVIERHIRLNQPHRFPPSLDRQAALRQHFRVAPTQFIELPKRLGEEESRLASSPPANLQLRPSTTVHPTGIGVFARESIPKDTVLGRYGGTVLFREEDTDAREETSEEAISRLFDIEINNFTIWVDGEVRAGDPGYTRDFLTWQSHINHQWRWHGPPKANILRPAREGGFFLFQGSVPFSELRIFANCVVRPDSGDIVTLRNIAANEELTIDYGANYWAKEKPRWDWTKLPLGTIQQLETKLNENNPTGETLRELRSRSNMLIRKTTPIV